MSQTTRPPSMMPRRPVLRDRLAGLAGLLAVGAACSAGPAPAGELALSPDGALVIDARARVAWTRCAEGMRWTGKTCTGEPLRLSHAQAGDLARARSKAEGVSWRLPRVDEWRHVVDKSARPPGLDPRLFPGAPGDWHWTSSAKFNHDPVNPYNYGNVVRGRSAEGDGATAFLLGWAVQAATGEARGDLPKNTRLSVRLVQVLRERGGR